MKLLIDEALEAIGTETTVDFVTEVIEQASVSAAAYRDVEATGGFWAPAEAAAEWATAEDPDDFFDGISEDLVCSQRTVCNVSSVSSLFNHTCIITPLIEMGPIWNKATLVK